MVELLIVSLKRKQKQNKQMKNFNTMVRLLLMFAILSVGCGNNPKVIETKKVDTSKKTTGVFSNNTQSNSEPNIDLPTSTPAMGEDVHTVKALETIDASRYVYVRVQEGDETFWIATLKQPIEIGSTYHFHGGLLKTNFESKEHNKVFDKIYLVSNLISADHSMEQPANSAPITKVAAGQSVTKVDVKGSVKIKDIIANPKKYEGKVIQVSGKCVKLNANIMGRNWMHLQDGSKDGYDFVVTSDQMIPEGGIVTLAGTIHLKKDFGAGYFYEIIMEDASIVKAN